MIFFERTENIIGGSCHKYHFCRDKYVFVATKHVFCRDKSMLVATKLLSPQTRVCRHIFATIFLYFCRDKRRVCCDKTFVATKMIHVATPANDRKTAIVNRTNIGTVSKATLGKLSERRGGVHNYGLFPAHGYHELNRTQTHKRFKRTLIYYDTDTSFMCLDLVLER